MRFSIRYQLLLPLVALMLGLIGVSSWGAWSAGRRARQQIETQIDAIARTINSVPVPLNLQTLPLMKGMSGAEFLLCDEERRPIHDDAGKVISTLTELPRALPEPGAAPTQHLDMPVQAGKTFYLCGAIPLSHHARPGMILYVLYPEALWQEAVRQALHPALAFGIGGTLISVFLSVLLVQRLTRRIQELERRTRLIAAGDFSPMPLSHRNDELRDLGRSVNEMAQRLAAYQETIRQTERLRLLGQVSGGLAHQLRNGVAGARLAVQLHAQECPTPHEQESLTVALRQLALVEMYLKKFLNLGKALELNKQPCDLSASVREAVELLGPQCRHAHIDLRPHLPQTPVPINGDPAQLSHLFLNVISNAVEAAGPGGWVEVRCGTSGNLATVEVRDSGPGPAPEIAARLFEPFVTGKREGVGLGLAVARQVAAAHGGTLRWRRDGACTCFTIELPLS